MTDEENVSHYARQFVALLNRAGLARAKIKFSEKQPGPLRWLSAEVAGFSVSFSSSTARLEDYETEVRQILQE